MHCPGYNATSEIECSGNGFCNDTEGICTCDADWFSLDCARYCDNIVTCSGHGKCDMYGYCDCEGGYSGDSCTPEEKNGNDYRGVIIGVSVTVGVLAMAGGILLFLRWRKRRGYEPLRY
jgi:hypothetical protein